MCPTGRNPKHAAVAVTTENPTTENHAERMLFAKKILYGEISTYHLAYAVLTNPTIQAKIEAGEDYDGDLDYIVDSVYDSFALTGAI